MIIGGSVAAGALSSYLGGKAAAKESAAARAQAADFTNKAIAALEKVGIETVEAQKIALETPNLVFKYVPELEKEFPELKSEFEQIETDPRLKAEQAKALEGLSQRAEGGLTPDDIAQIQNIRNKAAGQARAQDASIMQNMEQRGIGGSGAELMARLAASQQAAQQASLDSQQLASQDYQAKIDALMQLGNLAGSQREQAYQEEAQKATALDRMKELNQAARYDVQGRNVSERNRANLGRQELAQQLENQRAATANQEQMYNKQLIQQKFENEMAKAGAASSAYTGAAQGALQAGATAAANKQAMWSGIGQAGMGGAQLYGASQDRALKQKELDLKESGKIK